jgi:putative ABC transport system permease protein
VVAQIAAALGLLVVAGLAVRSAGAMLRGPQGYEPDHLLTLGFTLPEDRYPGAEERRALARDALGRLSRLPGVTHVAYANVLPARGGNSSRPIEVEGAPAPDPSNPPRVDARSVSPGYFDALGIPVLAGRGLEAEDDSTSLPVAVVSRSLAERYFPGVDPLGRRFKAGGEEAPWLTVVGVSGDVIHQWFARRNYPTFYRPYDQDPRAEVALAVRTTGDPESLAASARAALMEVDPELPASGVESMRRAIGLSTIGLQYVAAIMAVFGGLALILALTGVYGVMSYRVSLRTSEIGVRVALGASRLDVLRLTLGQALRLTAAGLLLGGALGSAAARALSAALMGAVPFDATTFAGFTALLATGALFAAWVPARRALAVDPARALRAE